KHLEGREDAIGFRSPEKHGVGDLRHGRPMAFGADATDYDRTRHDDSRKDQAGTLNHGFEMLPSRFGRRVLQRGPLLHAAPLRGSTFPQGVALWQGFYFGSQFPLSVHPETSRIER